MYTLYKIENACAAILRMYDTGGNTGGRGGKEFEAEFNVSCTGYESFPTRAGVIPNAELIPAAPRDTCTILTGARALASICAV